MKAVIYFQILFFAFFLFTCAPDAVEKKSPDEGITLKFGQQKSVSYLGRNYDLLVYDVNVIFREGVYTEDNTGSLFTLYDIGLVVNQDSVTVKTFTSVSQTGKRTLLSFETLSQYPATHNYIKRIDSLQIAVSDVYQEPETEFVKIEDYKVKLLLEKF